MHVRIHLFAFSRFASIVFAVLMGLCFCLAHFVCSSAINQRYTWGNWKLSVDCFDEDLHCLLTINGRFFLFLPYILYLVPLGIRMETVAFCVLFFSSLQRNENYPCLCVRFGCVTTLIYFYHLKEFTRMFLPLFRLFDEYMCSECFFVCLYCCIWFQWFKCVWERERERARM